MRAKRSSLNNKTRLSWWFPQLPSEILVPQTTIIHYEGEDLLHLMDGKTPDGFHDLCARVIAAGNRLGWPFFLRTDYLSDKHGWKDTCFVETPEDVSEHITNLVETSAVADIWGFPTDYWIARKLVPTKAVFNAFRGEMPIVKERRYFVQDATVVCHHPYWPSAAFYNQPISTNLWFDNLYYMNVEPDWEINQLSELSSKVGGVLGGAWSIDWLWSEKERQWYLIDMAEAVHSYHWPGCLYETYAKTT